MSQKALSMKDDSRISNKERAIVSEKSENTAGTVKAWMEANKINSMLWPP